MYPAFLHVDDFTIHGEWGRDTGGTSMKCKGLLAIGSTSDVVTFLCFFFKFSCILFVTPFSFCFFSFPPLTMLFCHSFNCNMRVYLAQLQIVFCLTCTGRMKVFRSMNTMNMKMPHKNSAVYLKGVIDMFIMGKTELGIWGWTHSSPASRWARVCNFRDLYKESRCCYL